MAPDGAADAQAGPREDGTAPRAVQTDRDEELRTGLLVDWGGVLTTNLFKSFQDFCVRAGVEPQKLRESFGANPDFR
jgi:putative hydrolase of the HAD superfamily